MTRENLFTVMTIMLIRGGLVLCSLIIRFLCHEDELGLHYPATHHVNQISQLLRHQSVVNYLILYAPIALSGAIKCFKYCNHLECVSLIAILCRPWRKSSKKVLPEASVFPTSTNIKSIESSRSALYRLLIIKSSRILTWQMRSFSTFADQGAWAWPLTVRWDRQTGRGE